MERKFGLRPAHEVTAKDQLQATFPAPPSSALPLAEPYKPGVATAADVGITDVSPLEFIVMGDTGGISNPEPQLAVGAALAQETGQAFVYHVGDIAYYNGDPEQYAPQFYLPYQHVGVPIVGIPGNHDGDSSDGVSGSGIASFMSNFCTGTPSAPPNDQAMEYGRHTQTQPYHDWVLALKAVTIVGIWTNVPSGGRLEQRQIDWLSATIKAAPTDRPLVVATHHPPYSVDAHHGGSQFVAKTLDEVVASAGRAPELVISGHVHDYQRFTDAKTTYLVSGNGGYRNRHALASDATPGTEVSSGLTFDYGDSSEWGYVKIKVDGMKISGEYVGVRPGSTLTDPPVITPGKDTF